MTLKEDQRWLRLRCRRAEQGARREMCRRTRVTIRRCEQILDEVRRCQAERARLMDEWHDLIRKKAFIPERDEIVFQKSELYSQATYGKAPQFFSNLCVITEE